MKNYQQSFESLLVKVHGRSREQRYTKSADWEYIHSCAEVASPVPLFGKMQIQNHEVVPSALINGSVLSHANVHIYCYCYKLMLFDMVFIQGMVMYCHMRMPC